MSLTAAEKHPGPQLAKMVFKLSLTGLTAYMVKLKKIKCLWFTLTLSLAVLGGKVESFRMCTGSQVASCHTAPHGGFH